MNRQILKIGCLILTTTFFFVTAIVVLEKAAWAEDMIVIKVQPRIIALPGNKVEKVPISAARVRSDELKELNKKYNVVNIERLFELKRKDDEEAEMSNSLISLGGEPAEIEEIDLNNIFTKEAKKKIEKEGVEAEQVKDIFLLELAPDTDISEALNEYKGLEVVIDAMIVKRAETTK